jgi:hypothetical protein
LGKNVRKFRSFTEAEKADKDFYRGLTGQERLNMLVDLLNQDPDQRIERIIRMTKLPADHSGSRAP